jgi:hypothetical protein
VLYDMFDLACTDFFLTGVPSDVENLLLAR